MKKILLWLVVLVISISMVAAFSLSGCKNEEAAVTTAAVTTAAKQEELKTPIAGIEVPITVDGAKLLIVMATNDTKSGHFNIQASSPEETILYVEAQIVSGNIDLNTFANGISLTDDNGKKCLLVSYGTEKPFWVFMVPKASKSFTLHFPDGQMIKLDPILKMVP